METHELKPGDVVALNETLQYAGLPAGAEGVVTRLFSAIGTLIEVDFEGRAPVVVRPSLLRFVDRPVDLRDSWDSNAYRARAIIERGHATRVSVLKHDGPVVD